MNLEIKADKVAEAFLKTLEPNGIHMQEMQFHKDANGISITLKLYIAPVKGPNLSPTLED